MIPQATYVPAVEEETPVAVAIESQQLMSQRPLLVVGLLVMAVLGVSALSFFVLRPNL